MSLGGFLLVILRTYETQTTLRTGTPTHESHRLCCRLIGSGGREYHKTLVFIILLSFVNKTPPKYASYVNKTMRPLKYKNLGEMSIMRVPSITSNVIVRLNEVMDKLERNEQDSVEVIMNTLNDIEDRLE